jgi:hypothetical protein
MPFRVKEDSIVKNLFSTIFGHFGSQMSGYGGPKGSHFGS